MIYLDLSTWDHGRYTNIDIYIHILVGGLEHFLFFHILGIVIPIFPKSYIFQRGSNQPAENSMNFPGFKHLRIFLPFPEMMMIMAGSWLPLQASLANTFEEKSCAWVNPQIVEIVEGQGPGGKHH